MLESLLYKVVDLQEVFIKFFRSSVVPLGKILKKFRHLLIDYVLKNIKRKVMFTEA